MTIMEITNIIWFTIEIVKIIEAIAFCRYFFPLKRRYAFAFVIHNVFFFLSNFIFGDTALSSMPCMTVFVLCEILYFEGGLQRRLFVIIAVYAIGMNSEVLAVVVFTLLHTDGKGMVPTPAHNPFINIVSLLLQTVLLYTASKLIYKKCSPQLPLLYWLAMAATPLVSCIGLYALCVWSMGQRFSATLFPFVIFIMILLNYVNFYFYNRVMDDRQALLVSKLHERQILMKQAMLDMRDESDRRIQKLKHDLNYIHADIHACLEAGDVVNAKRSLEDILNILNEARKQAKSGNSHVDSILNYQINRAEKYGVKVRLDLQIPDKLSIDSHDISVLLGNAIDNAIDACALVPDKDRTIDIYMQFCVRLLIEISNPYTGEIINIREGNAIPTTKGDANEHGIGLISIREIVDKYDGDMLVNTKDNTFRLTIHLPEQDKSAVRAVRRGVLRRG